MNDTSARGNANLLHQACAEHLTPDQVKLVNRAKTDATPKFQALIADAIAGKFLPLDEIASEILRCARLALSEEAIS